MGTSLSSTSKTKTARNMFKRGLFGLFGSSIIALLAYRRRSLSRDGAAGAVATGTTIAAVGGWSWSLTLIFFFASSSLLSHFRARAKAAIAEDKFSKGSERDLSQVIANGGVAVLMTFGAGMSTSERVYDLFEAGFVGAFATANADTWATEIGTLNTRPPRLITTGKPVAPGTSGGLTLLGTSATIAGAFALGLFHWILRDIPHRPQRRTLALIPIATISGIAGSLFDSLLGATVQVMYYCPHCEKETERRIHSCGTPTVFLRGIPWVDNDVVNFATTLFGGMVAIICRSIINVVGA
jgi:uncharacterized protein (TIGR00297 family)